jgi:hypothetical protein
MNKELFFEDLAGFWKYAMQESKAYHKESRSNYNLDWSGGLTWEQTKTLAINGWRELIDEIEKYRVRILPIIAEKVLRPQQINSIAGYSVDVGSFLANQPECFITKEFEEKNYPGRIYKIVCSISASAAINPKTIIQKGAMVCALVDAIEYAGHRAEVICNGAMSAGQYDEYRQGKRKENGWFEVSVTVKKSGQPLEMSDLAYCLAHPSMLRRIFFSVAEIVGWSDFISNYGYPSQATDKGDIYIGEIFSGTVPDSEAINWVLTQLGKLGINLETDK